MTECITIDISRSLDIGPAERATLDHLRAGRRVVIITTKRDGCRELALHALPHGETFLAIRGTNGMVARSKYPDELVIPAFHEARNLLDGQAYAFKPERR